MSLSSTEAVAPDVRWRGEVVPVRRTFTSQGRALLAVARKEWIIFRRYPSWIVAMFVWPVLLPFGYIFTAKAFSGPGGTAVGSTLWGWLNLILWDVGFQLRNEQMRGTLESNWLCPVWRSTILLGGSLTKLGTSLVFLAITFVEFQVVFGIRLLGAATVGSAAPDLLRLLLFAPALPLLGALAFRATARRARRSGTLGQY
ncbi:MAG TPA: hypothetical protein VIU62_05540 [Chloroflexota bacterium]